MSFALMTQTRPFCQLRCCRHPGLRCVVNEAALLSPNESLLSRVIFMSAFARYRLPGGDAPTPMETVRGIYVEYSKKGSHAHNILNYWGWTKFKIFDQLEIYALTYGQFSSCTH